MEFRVTFPEEPAIGHKVNAEFNGFTVCTDQPLSYGGGNSAPAPFTVFLSAIATCAGWFLLRFLEARKIPLDGIDLRMNTSVDPETKALAEIRFSLTLPDTFPDKYRNAVIMAMHQCAVTRTIQNPPQFSTDIVVGNSVVLSKNH
ncbi:OsmC family protein [bacterium]|nr:OsmC family protein [candidate division CSSED10-310 bacterium]